MNTKEIRGLLGISRAEFSRRYGIPIRTLENYDAGSRQPPEWVMALLERAVREDAGGKTGGKNPVNAQK